MNKLKKFLKITNKEIAEKHLTHQYFFGKI